MLDWRTGYALPERPGVGEWLDALNSQLSDYKFLLTSRPWPRGVHNYPSTYMHDYPVGGLQTAEGVALLRQQGVLATQATDLQLREVVSYCDGHAFALTLLASLLGRNRSLTISLLRENPLYIPLWNGDMARNFLDHIYTQQLNDLERMLLLAFSLYREPVPLEASLALTDINAAGTPVLVALEGLLMQHLLQSAGEALYQVHMVVAQYIRKYGSDEHRQQALRTAHARAATYYLMHTRTGDRLGQQQRTISDLKPLIEAAWHRCQAALWPQAFDLIQQEGLFPDLRRLGTNAILIELYQLLFPLEKWHPAPAQEAEICEQIGRVSGTLGRKEFALQHYEHALQLYRSLGNRQGEGRALNHMASVQENLGRAALAHELHTQALTIGREIGDRKAEADSLNGLGWIAHRRGQQEEALHYYNQSLLLYQETGNRIGESDALHSIGLIYQILGKRDQALQLIERALTLRREVRDRAGEGRTLNNLGLIYAESGQRERAYACYQASLLLRKETGDRNGEGVVLYNIGKLSFTDSQYTLALACWLAARAIFAEVRSANRDAAQTWIDRLQAAVGQDQFLALLTEIEADLPGALAQIMPGNTQLSFAKNALFLPERPEEGKKMQDATDASAREAPEPLR
jgi:tetratricopeptide (TPR) repeat protein